MKLKKQLFKIHSWIGIRLSILFFIVCFSGTISTLSYELDWLFNKDIRVEAQTTFASRNSIATNFKQKYPNASMGLWLRTEEPYIADIIQKNENGKNTFVFANPHTGKIQGETQTTAKLFFRNLHYFLFIPFQVGHFIVLFFGFMLLISLVTALVFYKKWWCKLFKLELGKGTLVFFRSLHRLVGLWSVPFMLLMSITGFWYFLERTNVGGLSDEVNPEAPKIITESKSISNQDLNHSINYDKAIAVAEKEIPNLKVSKILAPQKNVDYIYLSGKSEVPLVRQEANRVYLDPYTYKVIASQKATEISTKMWINDIADPLHFGYWGGLTTKIIWFVFGLCVSLLVFSGIWITLKRKAVKRKKEEYKVMGIWRFVNWGIYFFMMFFMYYYLVVVFKSSIYAITVISFGWIIFLGLVYCIFSYKMKKAIQKK